MPRTIDYAQKVADQKAELERQLEILSKVDISKLEEKKSKLQDEIKQIDNEIASTVKAAGIKFKGGGGSSSGSKMEGKQVSFAVLKEYINKAEGKVLSIRKEGINTECVKNLVGEHSGELKYTKGTWPKVALKK